MAAIFNLDVPNEAYIIIDPIRRVAHSINRPCRPRLNIVKECEVHIYANHHRQDGQLMAGHMIHRLGAWRGGIV